MFGWLRKRRIALPDLDVVLYTRSPCPLCHDAANVLKAAQRHYDFQFAVVDIDTDPALVARYGWLVPVVTVGGRERFRGHVNPPLLERLLRAHARGG